MDRNRPRLWLSLAIAALALSATSCGPPNTSALTLDASTRRPEVRVVLCDDELVNSVTLRPVTRDDDVALETGRPIWRIEAARPSKLDRFVVGETPTGYTEVTALRSDRLAAQKLELVAETSERVGTEGHGDMHHFRLADLRPGELLYYGAPTTASDFEREARAVCSPNPFDDYGLPGWAGWIVLALIVGAYIGGSAYAIRSWVRVRRLRAAGVVK